MSFRFALSACAARALALLALSAASPVQAQHAGHADHAERAPQGAKAGAAGIGVSHAVARPTSPGQPAAAAYLTIENRGKSADRLTGVSSPVARAAEIHTMTMQGDVMKMREAGEIALPPAAKVAMKSGGGYHIMLMGLKKPLQAGDRVPLTLTFDKAGKVEVQAVVESEAGAAKAQPGQGAPGGLQGPQGSDHKHH